MTTFPPLWIASTAAAITSSGPPSPGDDAAETRVAQAGRRHQRKRIAPSRRLIPPPSLPARHGRADVDLVQSHRSPTEERAAFLSTPWCPPVAVTPAPQLRGA